MLKVKEYQEINQLTEDSFFGKMVSFISILKDVSEDDLYLLKPKEIVRQFEECKSMLKIENKVNKKISFGGFYFDLIDFNHITYGQFIDIESLISDGYIKNLHLIPTYLFLVTESKPFCKPEIEDVSKIDRGLRGEAIKEIPINDIIGTCEHYLNHRNKVFDSFSMFKSDDDVDLNELNDEEIEAYEEEKEEIERQSSNQWFRILNTIASNDATKFKDILSLPANVVFKQFDYLQDAYKKSK